MAAEKLSLEEGLETPLTTPEAVNGSWAVVLHNVMYNIGVDKGSHSAMQCRLSSTDAAQ